MVIDGDREGLLGRILSDDVLIEELVDFPGLGQFPADRRLGRLAELLFDDLVAQVDALIADVDAGAGNELLDLLLTLAAEGTLQQVATLTDASHGAPLPTSRPTETNTA